MANTILTPTMITREALRILHNKLTFIGTINRQYDDRFAKVGAKIGTALQVRLPYQMTTRTGAIMNAQDVTEYYRTLNVTTQKGVDVNFSSVELTMSMDDFSKRVLEPAMAQLAASIEADALSMTADIYQKTGTWGTIPSTLAPFTLARAELNKSLTPKDNNRHVMVDSETMATLTEGLKSLFHQGESIEHQYKEGFITAKAAGATWWENDMAYSVTNGTLLTSNSPAYSSGGTSDFNANTYTVTLTGSANTIKAGQIVTFANTYAVHPETKVSYGALQKFVCTAASAGNAECVFSPAISATGAYQNVTAMPTGSDAVTVIDSAVSGFASAAKVQNLYYHKDAFTFATADLEMPKGVDFAAREVYDGISMRVVRNYDITNDKFPCRFDILYGYKTLRAQMACRITK